MKSETFPMGVKMNDRASRPTITEVSRLAGVSISSVSRVLNGNTRNPDMLAKVNDAIERLGFVPSTMGQAFRGQRIGQVAFAVEDIGNPAYLAMVRAIQPVLRDAGLRLLLLSTDGIVSDEVDVIQSLQNRFVDALIICPIRQDEKLLQAIEAAATPVVVIGNMPRELPVDNVRAESEMGARLAVEHLIVKGCRRIGLINGPAGTIPSDARLRGYIGAVEAHDIADLTLIESAASFSFNDGLAAAQRLLDRTNIDGLLGVTDRLALAGVHVLKARGFSVPGDARVVGIDNSELAETTIPGLSSVDLGATELGRLAADLAVSRLADPSLPPRRLVSSLKLVERETSR